LSTIKGDFAGFYGTIEVDVDLLNRLLGSNTQAPLGASTKHATVGAATAPANPLAGVLPPVTGGLPNLLNSLLGGTP
jgi:phospholipid/cholesterol/gamma-HCH transport system substrate-binding protein